MFAILLHTSLVSKLHYCMARLLAFIQFDHVTQNLFEHLIEILLHIILIMDGLLFLDTNEAVCLCIQLMQFT